MEGSTGRKDRISIAAGPKPSASLQGQDLEFPAAIFFKPESLAGFAKATRMIHRRFDRT